MTLQSTGNIRLLMVLIPFYALGRFFNRKLSINVRVESYSCFVVNVFIVGLGFIAFWLDAIRAQTCNENILGVWVSIYLIECILFFCTAPHSNLLIARGVINEIEKNPQYDINQLATAFGVTQKFMKNIIEKLIKKGCITRVVTEEFVYWEIDTERCIKYKYKKND